MSQTHISFEAFKFNFDQNLNVVLDRLSLSLVIWFKKTYNNIRGLDSADIVLEKWQDYLKKIKLTEENVKEIVEYASESALFTDADLPFVTDEYEFPIEQLVYQVLLVHQRMMLNSKQYEATDKEFDDDMIDKYLAYNSVEQNHQNTNVIKTLAIKHICYEFVSLVLDKCISKFRSMPYLFGNETDFIENINPIVCDVIKTCIPLANISVMISSCKIPFAKKSTTVSNSNESSVSSIISVTQQLIRNVQQQQHKNLDSVNEMITEFSKNQTQILQSQQKLLEYLKESKKDQGAYEKNEKHALKIEEELNNIARIAGEQLKLQQQTQLLLHNNNHNNHQVRMPIEGQIHGIFGEK